MIITAVVTLALVASGFVFGYWLSVHYPCSWLDRLIGLGKDSTST